MNSKLVFILGASALSAAIGQVLFKSGSQNAMSLLEFLNWKIGAGVVFYAAGMVLWLVGLSRAPLSLVYPFTLLTFMLVGLASMLIFHERPTSLTLLGWGVLASGLILVHLGAK